MIYERYQIGDSIGWKVTLKVDGQTTTHGYSTRQLADDADKAIGLVTIRSETTPFAYMVDADGTTINGVYMTAPLTPTTQLVYTVYPGTNSTGNFQAQIDISFPDPNDSSKRINKT